MKTSRNIFCVHNVAGNLVFAVVISILAFHYSGCNEKNVGDCCIENLIVTASPANITIPAGSSANATIKVTAYIKYCEQTVTVSYDVEITGSALEWFNMSSCEGYLSFPGYSASTEETFSAGADTPPGQYEVELLATVTIADQTIVDAVSMYITVTANPADFSIMTPDNVMLALAGEITPVPVTINRTNGHSADINMSVENLPEEMYGGFNPGIVFSGNNSTELRLQAFWNASLGNYSIAVKGSDGTKERSRDMTLTIVHPFQITLDISSIEIAQGNTGTINVNVNRAANFTDLIILSVNGSVIGTGQDQVEAVFSVNPLSNPESLSVLTLSAGSNVAVGTYLLTLKAANSNNNIDNTAELNLTIN